MTATGVPGRPARAQGLAGVLVTAGITVVLLLWAKWWPYVQRMAGAAAGPVGPLLVTLPAVSIPGIVMVGRALGVRATVATTAVVAAGGLAGAATLVLLSWSGSSRADGSASVGCWNRWAPNGPTPATKEVPQ